MGSRYLIVEFTATTPSLKCVYTERYNLSTLQRNIGAAVLVLETD